MPIGPLNVDSSLRVETTGRGRTERRIDCELGRIGVRNGPNIAPPIFLGRSVAAAGPPLFLGLSRRDSNRQHRSGRRGAEDRARGHSTRRRFRRGLVTWFRSILLGARSVRLKPRAVGSGLAGRISLIPGLSRRARPEIFSPRSKRVALPPAVWEHQFRRSVHVVCGDARVPFPGRQSAGRLVQGDVGPHPLSASLTTNLADYLQHLVVDNHVGKLLSCRRDPLAQGLLCRAPDSDEPHWVGVECNSPPDYFDTKLRIARADHFDHQTEPVEELRPQKPFFRVHGPDQEEAGGVNDLDSLALYDIDPGGGGIQKYVDQMVRQQVDLVHIEDSPVGRREQTWPKGSPAFAEGSLEVERADYPIFGRPERQLHKRHGPLDLAPVVRSGSEVESSHSGIGSSAAELTGQPSRT